MCSFAVADTAALLRRRGWYGVSKDCGIYALVPMGYPLGRFGPVRRRPVDEVLHWEQW